LAAANTPATRVRSRWRVVILSEAKELDTSPSITHFRRSDHCVLGGLRQPQARKNHRRHDHEWSLDDVHKIGRNEAALLIVELQLQLGRTLPNRGRRWRHPRHVDPR